jgi:hypothetical protein
MNERQIVYNAIITPDGTLLESFHRHDYKCHEDTLTGKSYGIDGGLSYTRYIGDVLQDCKIKQYSTDDPHEVIRDFVSWGTYGKNGNEPLKFITVSKMSNQHILSIINEGYGGEWIRCIFGGEMLYRLKNQIIILD